MHGQNNIKFGIYPVLYHMLILAHLLLWNTTNFWIISWRKNYIFHSYSWYY